MPKKLHHALNDPLIRALKPKPSRYLAVDGDGLVMEVLTSGSKVWRFRYSLNSRQQPMTTIGSYPGMGLAEARRRAEDLAKIVANGVSPVAAARKARKADPETDTIKAAGELWFASQVEPLTAGYKETIRRMLEKDIYPSIGKKALKEVKPLDVQAICDKVKARGAPQMALATRNALKRLFEFAIARQLAEVNPAQAVVARFIATPSSRTRVLTPVEIGKVLRTIYASDMRRSLKLALHLLVLTMVRKAELINARWAEFDLEEGVWRIPGSRMKKEKEHWVYLPMQAIEMLRELRELTAGEYVFPSTRGEADRPISKTALNEAIKALTIDVQHFVLHDFRRTASTHLHEMGMPSDVIEKALAHSMQGVRGIYNRAEYAEERKRLLQLWANFVEAQIEQGRKVVIGNFA